MQTSTRRTTPAFLTRLAKLIPACLILVASLASSYGQSGTWTNDASGLWSNPANWLNGVVADGTDSTADFSTIDITAPRTVTLDASHNIGSLLFGDSGGTLFDNWTLTPSGGSILTLSVSSGSPTITVNNDAVNTNIALLNTPLAGTSGLTKTGAGTLVLGSVNNTYSGTTTISAGTLQLTNSPSAGPLLYMSFDDVSGNTVINDGSMGAAANGIIVGTNVSIVAGGRYGNCLQVGNGPVNSGGVFINNAVTLLNNTNNTAVSAWTVAMWVKTTTATNGGLLYQGGNNWASGNTRFYLAGNVNDTGGPYFGGVRNSQAWEVGQTPINDGNWHFVTMTTASPGNVKKIYVDGVLDNFSATNNNNGWTNNATGSQVWIGGAPNISDNNVGLNGFIDEVYMYNRALSQTEISALMSTSSTPAPLPVLPATPVSVAASSKLDLNGLNASVTSLTGSGIVDTTATNAGAPPITPTLTINNSSDIIPSTIITNSAGVLSVVKNGAGALTLTNANGYTGSTILNSGTLNINAASALGTGGPLIINGGIIDNTSGAAVTVINNKAEAWSGDFTFAGTANLSFGTGGVTLASPGTNLVVTVNSNTLSAGVLTGTASAAGFGLSGLTKAGAGTLLIGNSGNASPLNGPLTLLAGKVQMAGDINPATGLYGTGTIETVRGVNKWLFVNNALDETFPGILQTSPGATARELGFNKHGAGTLTLPSTNTFNDQLTIGAGVLKITGSVSNGFGNAGVTQVSDTANLKAMLSISGGKVYANKTGSPSVSIGAVASGIGAINLASGLLVSVSEIHIGNGNGAATTTPYAGLTMDASSTLASGSYLVVGFNNDRSVFNQFGGTASVTANVMTIAAGGANAIGVANLYGGTFTSTGANGGVFVGERGLGVLNVMGNASLSLTNNNGLTVGPIGSQTGWNGIANLLGGSVTCNRAVKGVGTGTATLNFNGGTLRSSGDNSTTFISGMDSVYVYSGGAKIDDGGFAVALNQTVQAPSGNGVISIPIVSVGSNYIDTPLVLITNIDGGGATASAQIDYGAGTVTNILVTIPGFNYSTPPSVTLFGGGGSGAVLGTPTLGAVNPGSLTKLGSGTLTITSTGNGFAGTTKVLAGTLAMQASALSTPTDLLVSNASLALDVSGTPSLSVGNVTLQGSATLAISYGNLSANPSSPAINASGSLTTSGANVSLSISALGLQPGQFAVIKYTGAALPNLNNFSLVLPPGVVATLVNNTGNDSIDLNVSSAPRSLTWYGANGTTWDVNTTVNWKDQGVDTTYLQYTNGAVVVGDAVTFDDTLTNDFVNPQPTNINLTAGIYSFPITVNSTLPYSFGGAGTLAGTGYLVKSNAGTLTIATSNSYSGGTFLYEGMVFVTNDFNLGGPSGALTFAGGTLQTTSITNTRRSFVTAASVLDVLPGSTAQFGGILSGSGTLSKFDSGTLNLTGVMSNAPAVTEGTLNVPASGRITTSGIMTVGNGSASNGVLIISGGTVQNNNNAGQFNSGIIAGSTLGSAGDIQMTSGTLSTFQQFGLGGGQGGYGALTMSGGTATFGSYLVVGFNNDNAVLNQSGGAITVTTNCLTVAAGGPLSVGLANFSGGTFVAVDATNGNASGRGGAFVGENGSGVVNVSGTAALTLVGDANVIVGRQSGSAGILNLRGGTITTPQVARGAGSAALSFSGGALKASGPTNAFIVGLNSATIYSGGAVIDDGGFAVTISQPLEAPTGSGVASIPVSVGGSGYIDIPIVTLAGGAGSNATAVATVSGGAVTGFTITSPGSGYNPGDGLSVTITGGGGTGATAGTPVLAANTGGGLLKRGAGTLTLTGANNYTGTTTVSNGTLLVTPAQQTPGSVVVSNSATFGVLANTSASATVGNLQLGTSSSGTNFLAFILNSGSNPTVPPLQAGTITVTGTNNVRLAGQILVGTFPLVKYTGAIAGVINPNVLAPQGVVATVSNDVADSILFVNVSSAISGITWTGTNSAPALTNVWGLNAATNWLAGSTPVVYTEFLPPGDPVIFNDSGSGTVLLSNTVSPANILFSNSLVNYSLSGTGHIAGVSGLTKQGSGNVLLNLSGNTFAGDTTVNAGTLQLGSATALPSGNLVVNSNSVVDLNNNSPTINGLNGSGLVNNSGGTAVTLTVGNGNGAGTWNGTINNSGAGSISLTKVGTNTLVLSGTNNLGSGTASQMNGGLTIITNGALVAMATGEFWVQQNAGTATVIVDGGTLVTSNNWLVVGRNNTGANGTLIVNRGLVQKMGANNIVVGSLTATGTLIVNGGQVLNNNNLWLGENTGAHATLQLNGGLIQANQIRANGSVPTSSQAFLNGGVLQCTGSNTNFIQAPIVVTIQSNGFVFDDNGFVETNLTQPWQDDGTGGTVTKAGSGTLYLDTVNVYSGTTRVTNGTLAGIGTIAGPVEVLAGGNIGAGDGDTNMGILTINNSLSLNGNATFRISKTGGVIANDSIAGLTSTSFGGTLTLNNITSDATPLAIGDSFPLFSGSGFSGTFAAIVPATPGNGLAWNTSALATTGVISIVAGAVNPAISSISPANPVGSSYPQTLSIVGSAFQSGCSVLVSNADTATGSTLAATFTDSAHISVTPTFGTATHNWQATVINPGGASSAPFSFVVTTAPRPGISSIKVAAGQVVLNGNNGTQGLEYSVLSSTNVTVPVVNWTSLATNTFGAGGSFSSTNAIDPTQPHVFYIIKP